MLLLISILLSANLTTGFMEEDIETKADKIFKEFTNTSPGAAVAVFKNDEVVFSKGYGLADLEQKTPIDVSTNFRLASVTKQFTAASILLLLQNGKLQLDTKLTEVLKEFPEYGQKITIKHLLQHTSGVLDYEDFVDDNSKIQLHDKDVLTILSKQDSLYFEPGAEHRYSNSGYALLSLIVERLSGMKFPDYLKEKIFVPLQMNESVAFINGYNTISNRAFGYKKEVDGFSFSDQSLTSAVLGDGGIYTSVNDMQKWDKSLFEAELLSPEMLNESWSKGKLNSGKSFDYGYGWRLMEYKGYRLDYHTGSTCGFSNVYMRFPDQKLSILVLMNVRDYPALEYGKQIADLFLP